MALEKQTVLYSARIMFNDAGTPEFAEVVSKIKILEDGVQISESEKFETVGAADASALLESAQGFLAAFAPAKAAQETRIAEARVAQAALEV